MYQKPDLQILDQIIEILPEGMLSVQGIEIPNIYMPMYV